MNINIDTKNLAAELAELNNLLDDYEDIYLNLYNEISSVSFFWQDKNEMRYLDEINTEKQKSKNAILELNNIKDIYNYLLTNYQEIGNNIKCNMDAKDSIISRINTYLLKLNNIIALYNSLDLSFCTSVIPMINSEKQILNNEKKNVQRIKESLQQNFNKIETIEKTINLKISKINLEIIKNKEMD